MILIKTADEAGAIAKKFASEGWPDSTEYGVTSVAFDGTCFLVRESWAGDGLIEVKVDREGNVVGWSVRPYDEPP